MIAATPHSPMLQRLWVYQSERFPLGKTALLLAVFTSASISASAHLASRPLPGWGTFTLAFLVTFVLFFQLRACDEVKDREDDARYRPERPVPRGLVTLRLIVGLAVAAGVVAALATGLFHAPLLVPLAIVWGWLALMTAEFFVADWLKARPLLYLVSHMAIMPLIDLFITACEWLPHGPRPPSALWLFLALSFANGCVLELGRKLYAPQNERAGVETYSAVYGPKRAAMMWIGCVVLAYALLVGVGVAAGHGWAVAGCGALALAVALHTARAYMRAPSPLTQKRMDTIAGLWVFCCYALAGFTPQLAAFVGRMVP